MQEVSCLHWHPLDTLHISQHADAPEVLQVQSADAAGGVAPVPGSSENDGVLSWAFSIAEPSTLQLLETHADGQRSNNRLKA